IVRRWTAYNNCTQQHITHSQAIKLTDIQPPVLACPSDMTIGTDFWYCYANISVQKPVATDACSEITTYSLTSTGGVIVAFGDNYVINELGLGTHTITWTVYDECDNSASCSFQVTVVDNVPPVATCDAHTIVTLTNDGPQGVTLIP